MFDVHLSKKALLSASKLLNFSSSLFPMIIQKTGHLKQLQALTQPVSSLKGVGPSRSALFMKKGIRTVLDLLFFIPIRYEDRTRVTPISMASEGEYALVSGRVISGGEQRFPRTRKRLFKILLQDGNDTRIELLWFRYRKPHLAGFLTPDARLTAWGKVEKMAHRRQMIHPEIWKGSEAEVELGICPVYSGVRGMTPSMVRKTVGTALAQYLPLMIDPIPEKLRKENDLPALREAVGNVHFPPHSWPVEKFNEFDTPFHKRITFDRFFLIMLIVAFLKRRRLERTADRWKIPSSLKADIKRTLPFELTADQSSALSDILADLASGKPMSRLLLGDVGCGKTIIAALAAHLCIRNDHQTALMAPTQVLAHQHLEYFQALAGKMGFRPALVTGRLKSSEKGVILEGIANGEFNLIIGTHSLVQEDLAFKRLGLVIIDEQQRFGVRARAMLEHKSIHAHQLVMTATPIPRTLAIAVYGDMDLSVIREFPRGRAPVLTYLVGRDRKKTVYERLKQRLARGQQAFVICPSIESGEEEDLRDAVQMARRLKKLLSPPYEIGLIHGRLPVEERIAVMDKFHRGIIQILVGTTVLEVGVHVPQATTMIIEHPERFGLSQLHQLRGRVGRGKDPGLCLLMISEDLPEKARQRLQVLVDSHDGFEIARKDLEQRGYGQFAGTVQAGVGELDIREMMRESDLLWKAKRAAGKLIDSDPDLSRPEHRILRSFLDIMLTTPVDL
jgi:ATP-dependent DNA helicase RecG